MSNVENQSVSNPSNSDSWSYRIQQTSPFLDKEPEEEE